MIDDERKHDLFQSNGGSCLSSHQDGLKIVRREMSRYVHIIFAQTFVQWQIISPDITVDREEIRGLLPSR